MTLWGVACCKEADFRLKTSFSETVFCGCFGKRGLGFDAFGDMYCLGVSGAVGVGYLVDGLGVTVVG